MNELDVVRGIGADTPDPDAATTSAARSRLLGAIGAEAAAGGAAATDTGLAVDLGARRMARHARRAGRRADRRRRLLPAGAAVAAVLATALAAPLLLQPPTPGTPEPGPDAGVAGDVLVMAKPAAVKLLTATAEAAARAPDQTLGPGQYWYIREHGPRVGTNHDEAGSPKSYFYRSTYKRETWWAVDGTEIARESRRLKEFLTPADRAKWIADGRPKRDIVGRVAQENPSATSDQSDGWLPLTYEQIQQLPTDPARLTKVLTEKLYKGQPMGSCPIPAASAPAPAPAPTPTPDRRQSFGPCPHRPVTDGDLFGGILFLLEQYPLPAEVRSALYQLLTQLDGVRLVDDATDAAGRRGVSITMDGGESDPDAAMQTRSELIFDPDTGQALGYRRVLTAPVPGWPLTAGTVMDDVAFDTAVADSRPTDRRPRDPDA